MEIQKTGLYDMKFCNKLSYKVCENSENNFEQMTEERTVVVDAASNDTLIEKIKAYLDTPDLYDFERIEDLLAELKKHLFFYIESPYIDNHYRDTYYSYYAAKFQDYYRNCLRVHIFSESVQEDVKDYDGRYFGYFIIRPLPSYPLGRSFISPNAFEKNKFVACLCRQTVNFSGFHLSVDAFPHVVQDEETHKCAESVIWMLLSYFGTKFGSYNTLLPSQIRQKIDSISMHRLLPSNGLTLEEITICLNSVNHNCLYYLFDDKVPLIEKALYFITMRIYIESGMPFIVAYTDEHDTNGHVVLAIGHEELDFAAIHKEFSEFRDKNWHDVSSYKKQLVFMDDNFPQYVIDNCEGEINRYKAQKETETKRKDTNEIKYRIRGFIVPTHKHMHMDALGAYKLVTAIFDEQITGLASEKTTKRWITRLLLTSSKHFKHSLIDDKYMLDEHRGYFLNLLMPRFVWLCEIYDENTYKPNKSNQQICSGILIIDATEVGSIKSVLAYYLDNTRYENNGSYLHPKETELTFRKKAYKHNLKGAWNEWQS